MRRTRTRLVDTVTDRTMHAYLAGFRAGQEGVSYERAVLNVATDPDRCLHVDEQIAYAQLLPATWWAAFNRGHTAGTNTRLPTDQEMPS